MRSGEFTVNSAYDPSTHLSCQDVAVDSYEHPSLLSVKLRHSKMDQEGVGICLYVGRIENEICPVAAMLHYLVARRSRFPAGPLFL